jgi:Zn finger protein HypA/HybF involved in hydrogenase expression
VAEGAKVKVRVVKPSIKCESCGFKGRKVPDEKDLSHHHIFLSCPQCGSGKMKVEKGRECDLRRIQVIR